MGGLDTLILLDAGGRYGSAQPPGVQDRLDGIERELKELNMDMFGGGVGPVHSPGMSRSLSASRLPPLRRSVTNYSSGQALASAASPLAGTAQPGVGMSMGQFQQQQELQYQQLMLAHKEVVETLRKQTDQHNAMLKSHAELMAAHTSITGTKDPALLKRKLGVIRLDTKVPPSATEVVVPCGSDCDLVHRVVPGLTFEMCQSARMSHAVQVDFVQAIEWLGGQGVAGITGDCGLMLAFQPLAREVAAVPVFMSVMLQSALMSAAYDRVLILTADREALRPQKEILRRECGFDVDYDRFVIHDCQEVPDFDALAKGYRVDAEQVATGIVTLVRNLLQREPSIRAICLESVELAPCADAIRLATDLPVFDVVTCADMFLHARKSENIMT